MASLSSIDGIGPRYNMMLVKCNIKTSEKLFKLRVPRSPLRVPPDPEFWP